MVSSLHPTRSDVNQKLDVTSVNSAVNECRVRRDKIELRSLLTANFPLLYWPAWIMHCNCIVDNDHDIDRKGLSTLDSRSDIAATKKLLCGYKFLHQLDANFDVDKDCYNDCPFTNAHRDLNLNAGGQLIFGPIRVT